MDWMVVVLYTLVSSLYLGPVSGHTKWRQSCPKSYEEWTQISAESGSDLTIYPAKKLSMTFLKSSELQDGYEPLGKYEVTLDIVTEKPTTLVDFLISATGDEGCGSGLFVAKDPSQPVRQLYCIHRAPNVSTGRVDMLWKAPECGCVKFMVGAHVDGHEILGDDFYFSGHQAHKICPDTDYESSEKEMKATQDLDDILDPRFYGIDEEDVEEEENESEKVVKKEVDLMKKVYKTRRGHHHKKQSAPEHVHQKRPPPAAPCKDQSCRKIHRIATHYKRRYNRLKKWPKKLCILADSLLSVKPSLIGSLDEQQKSWLDAWKKWKFNIGRCCKENNQTELETCLVALGPLPVPWTRKLITNNTNAVMGNTTPENKLSNLCKRVSAVEWQHEFQNKHVKKKAVKADWEKIWHQRREDIMDCCELNSHDDRMDCVADIRMEKIDDMCLGRPTPFPGGMAENRKIARKYRRLSKKCCSLKDEERYECFDGVYGWNNSTSTGMTQKRMSKRKKHDPNFDKFRHHCCKHGREDGIEIHDRRWAKCNHKAVTHAGDTGLVGHKKGVCKRMFRQCCVRHSHKTIVEDPLPASTTQSVESPPFEN